MSLKISIELPLETAAAIQNGEHNRAKLSDLVIDAVNDLPMRLPAPVKTGDNEMVDDSEDSDSIITPAPSSENETFTLVESRASGTTTPKTEDEAFYIDVERLKEKGVPCSHYFPLVKKSMTVAELHEKIERHCAPPNRLTLEAQRFLLSGKRMRHGDTLGSNSQGL
ncbi:hypothetical protein PRZ48_009705 [Zasmidium cellare]|uniref:Uncharacterized protein n=1 Tax=Zasmidium cellare TaxID=395010 RepID=A0ABR0ECK8_ZASCE|nr:hypothetical protein PRZ48_009705 [Zasmidium cellare]